MNTYVGKQRRAPGCAFHLVLEQFYDNTNEIRKRIAFFNHSKILPHDQFIHPLADLITLSAAAGLEQALHYSRLQAHTVQFFGAFRWSFSSREPGAAYLVRPKPRYDRSYSAQWRLD